MCCRVVIEPLAPGAIDLLRLAGFALAEGSDRAWMRQVDNAVVRAICDRDRIDMSLQPAIATMEHHAEMRLAGALMFKVADRLAELGRGTITHASNIGPCAAERGSGNAVIASYPWKPLRFENLCLGFRTIFGADLREAA